MTCFLEPSHSLTSGASIPWHGCYCRQREKAPDRLCTGDARVLTSRLGLGGVLHMGPPGKVGLHLGLVSRSDITAHDGTKFTSA